MYIKMIRYLIIFISSILFLRADCQDLTCSTSWEPSCPTVDPLVSGPTCPEGFDQVEEYCFKVSEESLYWNESKIKCEELNAKLAEPRELLNSTEFLNYLLQNVADDNSTYEYSYYDYYDGIFSLGGQFTNNSWKWLTGGNISYEYLYGTECLAIQVYDYGDYSELSRSKMSDNVYFYLFNIPCNNSFEWQPQRDYSYGNYRYVCQAPLENNSYSSCDLNGNEYPSGQLVSTNKQQCQQHWCQDGDIQQYICGNATTGCCEYQGQLYGNGDKIGPEVPTEDCSGCQQQVCQAGLIQWQDCTNCSTKCCFFNGESHQPGTHIQSACARLVCDGTTGQFNLRGIDYNCPKCKAYLDPHIVTYDQRWSSYSYQGCGNYSLSQVGNTYQPTMAIYATFVPCGGTWDVTCVDIVTFKNDEHTVITIGFEDDEIKIEVNDEDYMIASSSPRIVKVLDTSYPVVAWTSGNSWGSVNCVNLQGSSGILVRFCGSSWSNQVYVWADSEVTSGLVGLCGSVNDDVDDDFSTRDGTITSPWQRNPPLEFPLSWLTSVTGNTSCDDLTVRVKRQAQDDCDTNSSVLEKYQLQCKNAVYFPNAEPEELQTIIADCVFDLCNVNDTDAWIQAVRETVQVQADIQENTLNFTEPITTTTAATTITTSAEPDTTTVEPYTTTPNTTIDCNCKRKCWKKSGFCTNEPETCDGRVKDRGCGGLGCVCCIPKECRPKKKCYRKGGFCISSDETCEGTTTAGCWGQDCVCCLKTGRCQPKKNCWSKGGVCVANPSHCKGKIIENGCKSENCYCCVNQPKC